MAVAGYQISSDNSKSQQQPNAGYKQTSKLLPGMSSPTSMKATQQTQHMWHFKYINTVPAVL